MTEINQIKKFVLNIYEEIDSSFKLLPSVCTKGCSHCCMQTIEVVNWEYLNISEYISKNLSPNTIVQIHDNIKKWAIFFNIYFEVTEDNYASVINFNKLVAKHKIPCPFLSNNVCLIYLVRPLTCRVHIIDSNPEWCRQSILRTPNQRVKYIGNDYFNKLLLLPNSFVTFLPILLYDLFNIPSDTFKTQVRIFNK